jgi:hypothetical protein
VAYSSFHHTYDYDILGIPFDITRLSKGVRVYVVKRNETREVFC